MLFFIVLALIAFFVSATMPNRKWVFWVAVFLVGMAVFAIPAGIIFDRGNEDGRRLLVQALGGGALLWQRERLRPYLKQWGIIDQWERLKAKLAEQRAQTAPPREEPQTDEEQEKDRQFRITVGERFGELEPSQIVRGVWESVMLRQSSLSGTVIKSDAVEAVDIAVINGLLTARSENKKTFDGALKNPLQPDAPVTRIIELGKINSIELATQGQFYGETGQPVNTGRKPPHGFRERHPDAVINGLGNYRQDHGSLWIVFAFLHDGERSPLLKSFNYDACVKWRTQIANLVQAERMKMAQTPVESDEDYL